SFKRLLGGRRIVDLFPVMHRRPVLKHPRQEPGREAPEHCPSPDSASCREGRSRECGRADRTEPQRREANRAWPAEPNGFDVIESQPDRRTMTMRARHHAMVEIYERHVELELTAISCSYAHAGRRDLRNWN